MKVSFFVEIKVVLEHIESQEEEAKIPCYQDKNILLR